MTPAKGKDEMRKSYLSTIRTENEDGFLGRVMNTPQQRGNNNSLGR